MTTTSDDYIRIPAPKFELDQSVVLDWEHECFSRITERLFNLDEECWLYQVAGSEKFYSSEELEAEIARPKGVPKYAVGQLVGSPDRPVGYRREVESVMWDSDCQEYIYKLENEELWFSEDQLEPSL